ncbi:MAG: hypothetical protein C6P37_09285 [Caldibacillus debilis]|uniref:Uncharacterized protein n=1 Tax=Caldibacillus debilis TaxID=301148 RepID=A0A3E0K3X2_9BACI|nr:MAG: hypothetical protein C6P37_09285 [Caldibacillus debilis]
MLNILFSMLDNHFQMLNHGNGCRTNRFLGPKNVGPTFRHDGRIGTDIGHLDKMLADRNIMADSGEKKRISDIPRRAGSPKPAIWTNGRVRRQAPTSRISGRKLFQNPRMDPPAAPHLPLEHSQKNSLRARPAFENCPFYK